MNDREKLAKILEDAEYQKHYPSTLASVLLANGVVVREKGEWVHCNGKSNLWYCSKCGEKIQYNPTRRTYNIEKKRVDEVNKLCRNCGADMRKGKNG